MERVLTQEEIDAMVQSARGRDHEGENKHRSIKPCSFRQSGQLTGEQVRTINGLHETFARSLTQSLGAYLRVIFEVNLVSVEQLAYGEFLERVPEVTYMMSFQVPRAGASAAMQIDHSLVFPLVDILLGGTGVCEAMTREVSEIEEQIVEGVARIICRELSATWVQFAGDLELEQRQTPSQMQRFLPPTEKTLCLSFEIKLAEARGMLNLIFPTSISTTLLRKLSADRSYGKPRGKTISGRRLADKMLDCPFPAMLGLTGIKLPIQTVMTLTSGEVCNFGVPVRLPASLVIAGRETFECNPVRHGHHRAAQVGAEIAVREERRQ